MFKVNDNLKQANCNNQELQWIDLKYMADQESEYKKLAKYALAQFKLWRRRSVSNSDIFGMTGTAIEGTFLRYHAENALKIYYSARKKRQKAFQLYLQVHCRAHYRLNKKEI